MPSLKRDVSKANDKTGFEPYDGPTPRKGLYRGLVKSMKIVKASTGRLGFNILVELAAEKGSPAAQYDGYPAFTRLWLGDSEQSQTREKQLYTALVGTPTVNLVYEADDDDKEIGKVTSINKKNPVGTAVIVELAADKYNGEDRIEGAGVLPLKKKDSSVVEDDEDEDDEDDLTESEDDEEGDEIEVPSEAELKKMPIKELRELGEELGVDTDEVKKKLDLVAAILERAEVLDEDEEEEEEEDDDLEDAEDEEEEDDEEEEEDDEDVAAQVRAELEELDRTALKARLKESNPEFKVLKRHTDEDLVEAILAAEVGEGEPPF